MPNASASSHTSFYAHLDPFDIEAHVAKDFEDALAKRGAHVAHDGRPGRPDIVVEGPDFAILVEVAKRSGADAASEFPAVKDHRAIVERETGKPTHVLFSCLRTPERYIRLAQSENAALSARGEPGRYLFLNLEHLGRVLSVLAQAPATLYPLARWDTWFAGWEEVGNDLAALERLHDSVLAEDTALGAQIDEEVEAFKQRAQERLRKDIQRLEDDLRHRGVVKEEAHRTLVYTMFVKLYEEKRESPSRPNRFTKEGFARYREQISAADLRRYRDRTLHHLIERQIAHDEEVLEAGILGDFRMPEAVRDEFVESYVLEVLDRYRFRGTLIDALGAVFEALARRGEKDVRIGQFFTPEPIVRFAVDVAAPRPTETILDPAAGTARFLTLAMDRMVARADQVPGHARDEVVRSIRSDQILGTDADSWVSRIAKMNMYIHGDGKSNIRQENGLFLADLSVFPGRKDNLKGAVDVCLTNPPLGDMGYRSYAQDLREREGIDPAEWIRERLPILPGQYREEAVVERARAGLERWRARQREAILAGDERDEAKAERYIDRYTQQIAEAEARLRAGQGEYVPRGTTAKGSALFLAAIQAYLNPDSDPGAVEEWRGGRLAIIVDEAILNAREYAAARAFIHRHYFVKAVFSFNRDAFWYQARTTAKTSLLYLYVKPDPEVLQREPTLFCHIDRIGFTRTGQPSRSDLPAYLTTYKEFEAAVRGAYTGHSFDVERARESLSRMRLPLGARIRYAGEVPPTERLDFAFEAARQVRAALPEGHPVLRDVAEIMTRHPVEDETGYYTFATVNRKTGDVVVKGVDSTEYRPQELREIEAGDIVLSGIDLVHGAAGYAYDDVQGAVVSKEFYTLRVRDDAEVDPRYLALLLRTPRLRDLVAGTVTGTSNRTRIDGPESLLNLPLPTLPPIAEQRRAADAVEAARATRRKAASEMRAALEEANRAWTMLGAASAEVPPDEEASASEGAL